MKSNTRVRLDAGLPAAISQAPIPLDYDEGTMFLRMEQDVQRTLALLELFSRRLALVFNEIKCPERDATGIGCLELANDCTKALFRDWSEACNEAKALRGGARITGLVGGEFPAALRLGVSVAEAAMLMDRFGNELEDEFSHQEHRRAEREGGEPKDRHGYLTIARRCRDSLWRSFDLAWNEWHELDKSIERAAAA